MRKELTDMQKRSLVFIARHRGEDLMPCDCADIIARRYGEKTRRALGLRKLARMVRQMMECNDFWCDNRQALEAATYLV